MKTWKKIAAGAVALFLVFAVLIYAGVININLGAIGDGDENRPPTPSGTEVKLYTHDRDQDDLGLFTILEKMFDKDLPYAQTQTYFDTLHMEVWGRDDMNAQQFLETVEATYSLDGWTSLGRLPQTHADWTGYYEAWTRGNDARTVSAGQGAAVTTVFGHDLVYFIAHGPTDTYLQFWNLVVNS